MPVADDESVTRTARHRPSAGARVLRAPPAGRGRGDGRSGGTALQRQRAGALRPGVHASRVDMPTPANLSAVFDHFVADTTLLHDAPMMETAGAQCLLLAGFFEDQMRAGTTSAGTPSWAPASSAARPVTSPRLAKRGCWMPSRGASSRGADGMRRSVANCGTQPYLLPPPTASP